MISRQPSFGALMREHGWILLPLLFTGGILLFYPFRFVFEFNPDEGLHLMRALLQMRGDELYGEIYNDQPPLFTFLLTGLFRLLGPNVTLGRLLVLLFSTGLIFSGLGYLKSEWGLPHVFAAWVLFLLLPTYRKLSVSVMIGLPAIALGVFSFYALTRWHRQRSYPWLTLSAIALACSTMIKAFTGILAPIFALGLLAAEVRRAEESPWQEQLKPAITWILTLTILVAAIALLGVGAENLPQLVRVHLSAREAEPYLEQSDSLNINSVLYEARGFLLLAAAGAVTAVVRRRWSALYLVGWAVLAYAGLSITLPVWSHHQLLVTIPAVLLAGIFLGQVTQVLTRRAASWQGPDRRFAASALGLLAAIVLLAGRIPWFFAGLDAGLPNVNRHIQPRDERPYQILAIMWEHAEDTELIVTDRPIFAFRLGKPVPPELAVISEKRLFSGAISQRQIIEVIQEERPAQVLLIRFPLDQVESYLAEGYGPIYYDGPWRLFLREDLTIAPRQGKRVSRNQPKVQLLRGGHLAAGRLRPGGSVVERHQEDRAVSAVSSSGASRVR